MEVEGVKTLMDKHAIIKLKQEGNSNRKIAKLLSIDRKTVSRYWNAFNEQQNLLEKEDVDILLIQEKIAAKPTYNISNRTKHKYTKEMDQYLDHILEKEKTKDSLLGNHKQKLTNKQIFKAVKAAGYEIGLSTISNQIKIKREKAKECFIKQQYDFADRLEYDFGEVKLSIDGKIGVYHMAVLSSPAANFRWAYLYKNQKQDVFMDSHVKFFDKMGGVFKEVVYDNMKNVVTKFIGKNEKELNANLLLLSNYYGYKVNVTNCFSGNEKGHVEGSVKIIRNAVFAQRYAFLTYEDACSYLESRLQEMNQDSLILEEQKHLLKKRPPFELGKITQQKVNTYSFVQLDRNSYSVPDYLVGKMLTVKSYVDVVKIYSNHHFVCEHKKKDGVNEISIDINHYLSSLTKKPGAIRNSVALKSLPQLKSIFDTHFTSNPRQFIEILVKNKENSMETLLLEFSNYLQFQSETLPKSYAVPSKSGLESKTKNLLASYNRLLIGGLN